MTRTTALPSIDPSNGRVTAILGWSRTQMKMYSARPTAISSAGRIEPANSAPVEIDAVAAKRTAGMLGGITVLISEPDAVSPAENPYG